MAFKYNLRNRKTYRRKTKSEQFIVAAGGIFMLSRLIFKLFRTIAPTPFKVARLFNSMKGNQYK